MTAYIYLHGFASSPKSSKARYLSDRFLNSAFAPASRRDFEAETSVSLMKETPQSLQLRSSSETTGDAVASRTALHRCSKTGLRLQVLDLNQDDFTHLSLTRQIQQTIAAFPAEETPVTLIGSSFGALTAAWVAQQQDRVKNLILLAPAFGFPQSWYQRLEPGQIQQWRESGFLSIYHYGKQKQIPLHYQFLADAENYPLSGLTRSCPTLIIHGLNDEVVPIQVSRDYQQQHSQVELVELDSDHGLNDCQSEIWQLIQNFLQLGSK